MNEREFWLEERRSALIRVKAIEARWETSTVTVTMARDEARRLGLVSEGAKALEHKGRKVS